MPDIISHGPPTTEAPSGRTRRHAIGAAIAAPVLLAVMFTAVRQGATDSGVVGCASLSGAHQVTATDYPRIRAEFARSRWPDLRTDGTAYFDLAVKLRTAQDTDGYETVWFYQRLATACAKHWQAFPQVTGSGLQFEEWGLDPRPVDDESGQQPSTPYRLSWATAMGAITFAAI